MIWSSDWIIVKYLSFRIRPDGRSISCTDRMIQSDECYFVKDLTVD